MILKTAVIIAGGKGTRFAELGSDNPKPMLPVGGKPVLERIVNWLKMNGVKEVIISVAYKKEKIMEYFGDGSRFGIKIRYTHHSSEGGTEDAFKVAIESSGIKDEDFYAMNADQITDLGLNGFTNFHLMKKAVVTLLIVKLKTNFGLVELDRERKVTHFQEKWDVPNILVNSGIYIFNKRIKKYLKKGSIEESAFQKVLKDEKLFGFYYDGLWLPINTPRELTNAEKYVRCMDKKE